MTVFDTFQHSPAPFVAGQEYDYKRNEINSADGRCVAVVWVRKAHDGICAPRNLFKDDPEGMANWRLLIAAPELLEAIKLIVREFDDSTWPKEVHVAGCHCAICLARLVIAKAQGERT